MATNPMQRKARQSFLLGVVITLLLAAIVIFLLYSQIKTLQDKINSETQQKVMVYVLNQDVKSGQTITPDLFTMKSVTKSGVPIDATNDIYTALASYSLYDKQGNPIKTGNNEKGEPVLYIELDGKKNIVYQDEATGKYYRKGVSGEKVTVETTERPLVAKIAVKANTVITGSMITALDEIQTDDVREQTYNMISLPIDLVSGDYVDIRLMLPNGTDFIVLPKLKVTVPDINGAYISNTMKVNINEEQLLTMSSAIVEAYKIDGAKLYAIKYTEPGNQEAAIITYEPRKDIVTLIKNNPNIIKEAMTSLYNNLTSQYRENQINKYYDSGEDSSVISGIQGSAQATQENREEYLSTIFAEY